MAHTTNTNTQWPPRSPFEALLSSPSGRRRAQQLQQRRSISPSPMKKNPSVLYSEHTSLQQLSANGAMENADELEDEETLQLQLQAIQAKLKLKRLRQAKSKAAVVDSGRDVEDKRSGSRHISPRKYQANDDGEGLRRTNLQMDVQVPVSPPERKKTAQEPRSPGRVLLGIDKGLKGRDISLRRPPSMRSDGKKRPATSSGTENQLQQTGLGTGWQYGGSVNALDRPKTFSERIAESRAGEKIRKEREERIRKSRTKGFDISEKQLEGYKKAATEFPTNDDPFLAEARRGEPREYTRDEVLQSYNQPGQHLRRTKTVPDLRLSSQDKSDHVTASGKDLTNGDTNKSSADASQFESFSGFQLSKRILSHTLLTRTFSGKKIFQIPDLLKIVKAPEYDAPDVEEDWVLLGIIASKSSPRDHKDPQKSASQGKESSSGRGKYMVLSLTDLKWELELFLFSTAFDRFWKLTPGTVVAIHNPSIMPPLAAKRDTGRFSVMLNSSDETVLELGTARDLGFCKSVKKDGSLCNQWVDKRHTEFCTYHIDVTVRKTAANRMEVNTMTAPYGPGGRSNARSGMFGGRSSRNTNGNRFGQDANTNDGLKREGPFHDRATHSQIYVTPSVPGFGRTTASLLDDEDVDPDAFHRGYSKEERLRRHLAEREREREIARQLGAAGGGMGSAYLRASTQDSTTAHETKSHDSRLPPSSTSSSGAATAAAAAAEEANVLLKELKTVRSSSASVRLSPVKRKRSYYNNADGSSSAVGWAGAASFCKNGVSSSLAATTSTTKPNTIDDTKERARKKTRFVTDRGIREAGRESLGLIVPTTSSSSSKGGNGTTPATTNLTDDDDDDELEIIR